MICGRCSVEKEPSVHNPHICEECAKAENNRVSHFRRQNVDWVEVAKEADLQLWERQPGETDHEYNVWLCYRDAYPGKRPSYRGVAEDLNTTVNAVRKIASRWTFTTRLQAWAKHVDEITLAQRREEILAMNKKHVDMAATLNDKLAKAIENIDPYSLSPRELNSLMKTATELERKGRLDQSGDASGLQLGDDNPDLKDADVKTSDINEIVKILGAAGVLGNAGVRQTVTTEVVVKDGD